MTIFDGNNVTQKYSEQLGRKLLDELNLNYEVGNEQEILYSSGERCIYKPDAYIRFNKREVIIEFDGTIHNIESVKAKDKISDINLTKNGYIVLRFSLFDLMNNRSYVRSAILDALFNKRQKPYDLRPLKKSSVSITANHQT